MRIRRYAEDNDIKIIEICEDSGISGSKIENRPGMKQLIDLINDKKVVTVVSYKLDRLFRNASDAITTLNWLKKKQVASKVLISWITGLRFNRRKMLHRNWYQKILDGRIIGKIEWFKCKQINIFDIYSFLHDKFPGKQRFLLPSAFWILWE
jgi:hypothetical protein